MDYKYIEQLLERYWQCETTLQEEKILHTFFSQEDVPACLLPYKDLFCYVQTEKRENVLGDDFDRRILSLVNEPAPVKARVITFRQRLTPLFKAAAVVAILLTLGNAMQSQLDQEDNATATAVAEEMNRTTEGLSVAKSVIKGDSIKADTLQNTQIDPAASN